VDSSRGRRGPICARGRPRPGPNWGWGALSPRGRDPIMAIRTPDFDVTLALTWCKVAVAVLGGLGAKPKKPCLCCERPKSKVPRLQVASAFAQRTALARPSWVVGSSLARLATGDSAPCDVRRLACPRTRPARKRGWAGAGGAGVQPCSRQCHARYAACISSEGLCAGNQFLFGQAPTNGDFGLFGQLRQLAADPLPAGIVHGYPEVWAWVWRMDGLSGHEPPSTSCSTADQEVVILPAAAKVLGFAVCSRVLSTFFGRERQGISCWRGAGTRRRIWWRYIGTTEGAAYAATIQVPTALPPPAERPV
jgi:hypothetical protein